MFDAVLGAVRWSTSDSISVPWSARLRSRCLLRVESSLCTCAFVWAINYLTDLECLIVQQISMSQSWVPIVMWSSGYQRAAVGGIVRLRDMQGWGAQCAVITLPVPFTLSKHRGLNSASQCGAVTYSELQGMHHASSVVIQCLRFPPGKVESI